MTTNSVRRARQIARQVTKYLDENPRAVIEAVLTQHYPLAQRPHPQTRYDDDTCGGSITVGEAQNGSAITDMMIEVLADMDMDEDDFSTLHRFRAEFFGGQSPHTHRALRILAIAMELDNQQRPQRRT